MIDPILVAQALAIPITSSAWEEIAADTGRGTLGQRDSFLMGGPGNDIERAARTLAIERWPLRRGSGLYSTTTLEGDDGGSDGCPPAAVRHVLAGCLVLELAGNGGFRYGTPPPLLADWGAQGHEDAPELQRLPLCARQPDYESDYPDAPHYAIAHRLMQFYLGMSTSRDPEAPCAASAIVTDAAGARRAVDLAIRLLCDEATPVAEIVCDAAATLLHEAAAVRGDNGRRDAILAMARRMLRVVAPRPA